MVSEPPILGPICSNGTRPDCQMVYWLHRDGGAKKMALGDIVNTTPLSLLPQLQLTCVGAPVTPHTAFIISRNKWFQTLTMSLPWAALQKLFLILQKLKKNTKVGEKKAESIQTLEVANIHSKCPRAIIIIWCVKLHYVRVECVGTAY